MNGTQQITISGRNILRQYNELRAAGYTCVARGSGTMTMVYTGNAVALPVVECQHATIGTLGSPYAAEGYGHFPEDCE